MAAPVINLPLRFVRTNLEERWHFPNCKEKRGNTMYLQQVSSIFDWPIGGLLASCCRDRYERIYER